MEPPDLWERYIDPRYRNRAIRITTDPADGLEVMLIDNQPLLKGVLAGLGGANLPRKSIFIPGQTKYLDGCPPASYLPDQRVRLLDEWHVDAGVLFPTVGILWDVADNGLATAYARAYNEWLNDFASYDRRRVIPIAHLALQDPDAALAELRRCLKLGFKVSSSRLKPSRANAFPIIPSTLYGANARMPAFLSACTLSSASTAGRDCSVTSISPANSAPSSVSLSAASRKSSRR